MPQTTNRAKLVNFIEDVAEVLNDKLMTKNKNISEESQIHAKVNNNTKLVGIGALTMSIRFWIKGFRFEEKLDIIITKDMDQTDTYYEDGKFACIFLNGSGRKFEPLFYSPDVTREEILDSYLPSVINSTMRKLSHSYYDHKRDEDNKRNVQ